MTRFEEALREAYSLGYRNCVAGDDEEQARADAIIADYPDLAHALVTNHRAVQDRLTEAFATEKKP